MLRRIGGLAALVLSTGCATMFTGTTQAVHFPQAADSTTLLTVISASGAVVARGYTPMVATLRRGTPHTVTLATAENAGESFQVKRTVNGYVFLNLILWPGLVVDLATGSYAKFESPVILYPTVADVLRTPSRGTTP